MIMFGMQCTLNTQWCYDMFALQTVDNISYLIYSPYLGSTVSDKHTYYNKINHTHKKYDTKK